MIIFGPPRANDWPPFTYTTTEHECPECKTLLTRVDVSTMLTCSEGHGPYFLV